MVAHQQVGKKESSRSSNFEAIRIISMLIIVISHYFVQNGIPNNTLPLGFNRFIAEFFSFGNIGVVLFMLISGYFLGASKKKLQLSKLFKIIFHVLTCSIVIFIIAILLGVDKITPYNIAHSLAPITFKTYWFVTAYILIYTFNPYINKFINALSRKEYLGFLFTASFIFVIIRTVTKQDFFASQAGLFLLYYSIGYYLNLYKDNFFAKRKNRIITLSISVLTVAVSIIIFDLIGQKIPAFSERSTHLLMGGSITVVLIAICIFCAFAYARPFKNKAINIVASSTFGIYLFHNNYLIIPTIWITLLHNPDYINTSLLVPHMIGSVLLVFTACSVIELIRKNTLERFYVLVIAPKIDTTQTKISKKINNTHYLSS